jgi:hypothetical protein
MIRRTRKMAESSTELVAACNEGNQTKVELLLDAGVSPNERPNGYVSFHGRGFARLRAGLVAGLAPRRRGDEEQAGDSPTAPGPGCKPSEPCPRE